MPVSIEELRRRIAARLRENQSATIPLEFGAAIVAAAAESDGWVWPVVVCKAGWWKAQILGVPELAGIPQYIPREILPQIAAATNGARFRRRHPLEHEGSGDVLPELIAGWVENARVEGDEVRADIHLLPNETELRARLLAARDAGQMQLFNVSIYASFHFRRDRIEGRQAMVAERIARVAGLDLCGQPGGGGKFQDMRLAAALGALDEEDSPELAGAQDGRPQGADRHEKGATMKNRIIALLAALATFAQERAEKLRTGLEAMPEADLPKRFDEVVDAFVECANGAYTNVNAGTRQDPALIARVQAALAELTKIVKENGGALLTKANEALEKAEKIQFTNLLETKLKVAKLPEQAEGIVRAHLKDRVAEEAAVDAEITAVRAAFAKFSEIGGVSDAATASVSLDSQDKLQLAMDGMMGVQAALKDPNCKPFRGIQDAFMVITGSRDFASIENGGLYRVRAAITTASLPQILLNSMTKRLIQDYLAIGWKGLERLVQFVGVSDFKTQDRVRLGYFPDLATVAEDAAYVEIANPTDEKISYTISKRGNIFTLTEETIRNDDTGKLRSIPERLARAAIRTAKQAVTDKLITPGLYDPDGLAVFVAGHNNLGAVALTAAELDAREVALFGQTEPDSAKKLGFRINYIVIPINLDSTARQLNNNETGANNWAGRFGPVGAQYPPGIIVNEQLADANDWYYGTDEAKPIEMGVLDGADGQPPIPQILLANDPTVGAAFTNDRAQYKVKSVFGLDWIDFRGIGKNVVP